MGVARTALTTLLTVLLGVAPAWAQTGVSDDRVSLPDGPGSVEGLGDSASIDPNMGMMHYEVPIEVPHGFASVTPKLSLAYGSASGSSSVGIGWSMHVPAIERLTLRGLPRYDADDEFAADGGEQLVRVAKAKDGAVYRARFERSFVRYTFHDAGPEGYFTAEFPDGSVGYFGADAAGRLLPEARSSRAGHTFRYQLVEVVDVYGHRLRYDYTLAFGSPLLSSLSYVHDAEGRPTYRVELSYETRPDPVSDAKPGWDERLTGRLAGIAVFSRGERIRRYALTYERQEVASGFSRLARVETFGRDDSRYPVVFSFGYSRALGGVCEGSECERPFVVDMGTVPGGIQIGTGDATLVDLNGDALPDLVDSSAQGAHRIFLSQLDQGGQAYFAGNARLSKVGTRSAFPLSAATVQEFDVNGDGLADLTNSLTKRVLCNDGSGDWSLDGCQIGSGLGFTLDADTSTTGDPDPLGVRFLDVDNDRRVDLLSTPGGGSVLVRRNTGDGFEELRGGTLDKEFDRDRLFLADMNGDGLLDPVEIDDNGALRYRLHLGRAQWSDTWTLMSGPSVDRSELNDVVLEDLNADGLDDMVVVLGGEVRYALNRNGVRFADFETVSSDDLGGMEPLPVRSEFTTVVYADMNGNGSRDIVWIESGGQVRYLELFPVRANLLSRIENGLGSVQEVHYAAAAAQRHADPTPWLYPLAHAMNVVETLDKWVTLSGGDNGKGLHELTRYRYGDGYYDGEEKQFRGFARVEVLQVPDGMSQESGRSELYYDVGRDDPYHSGRLLSHESFTGDGANERPVQVESTHYEDCKVAEVPSTGSLFPVRFVCATLHTTLRKEGASENEWATIETRSEYDGYGNVTHNAELGVVQRGSPDAPRACPPCERGSDAFGAACGPACLGDERFLENEYVIPGANTAGRWLLHKPKTTRTYGRAGGAVQEVSTYYDGAPFVGLTSGQLTQGNVTRVSARVREGINLTIDRERHEHDAHGNVITTLDALGSATDPSAHRRSYTYEETGLRVIRTDIHLTSAEDEPYLLRREYGYEPAFDHLNVVSDWMVVRNGQVRSSRNETSYRYDAFGRRIATLLPGDASDTPSLSFEWDLKAPVSSIVTRGRSQPGGAQDVERVQCVDGRGGKVQERVRIAEGSYQVSGFSVLNSRGLNVRVYQPHLGSSSACATSAPEQVPYEDTGYDAAGREVLHAFADAALHGKPSQRKTVHRPLARLEYDEEDLDPASAHHDTPTVVSLDGLGRTVAVERTLASGKPGAVTRIEYDGLGQISAVVDALGNRKVQERDLLGRVIELADPSAGHVVMEYDAASNPVRVTDARGVATHRSFDGANRPLAQWEESQPESTAQHFRYDFADDCPAAECSHAAGRLVEASYPLAGGSPGVDHVGYDPRGQRVLDTRRLFGVEYRTSYAFDNAGRVTQVVHPDGTRVKRSYDGAARPTAIQDIVNEVRYDERGLIAGLRFANGITETWQHDLRLRLARHTIQNGDGEALQDLRYTRDRVGNVLTLSDKAEAPAGWSALEASFQHDAWYRTLGASYRRTGESETLTWQFDELDRLLYAESSEGESSTSQVGKFVYDPARPHAVLSAGPLDLGYDAAGNLSQRKTDTYTQDFLGRLTRVSHEGGSALEISYGTGTLPVAMSEDAAATLYISPDFEVRDGVGVTYVRLGELRVARLESDGMSTTWRGDLAPRARPDRVLNAADAWVLHGQELGLFAGEKSSSANARELLRTAARRLLLHAGGSFSCLHADHLGNLTLATNSKGEVTGRRRYRVPEGEDLSGGFVDDYGLSGQEEVRSAGLVRFKHRWLDPVTQRWTQPDPAFLLVNEVKPDLIGDLVSGYTYVGNRFANAVDPLGLTPAAAKSALRMAVTHVLANHGEMLRTLATGDAHHAHGDGGGYENTFRDLVFFQLLTMAHNNTNLNQGTYQVSNVARETRIYEDRRRVDLEITVRDAGGNETVLAVEIKADSRSRNAEAFGEEVFKDRMKLGDIAEGSSAAQLAILRPTSLAASTLGHELQHGLTGEVLPALVPGDRATSPARYGVYVFWQ
jgi:RHS repeat-associated protein